MGTQKATRLHSYISEIETLFFQLQEETRGDATNTEVFLFATSALPSVVALKDTVQRQLAGEKRSPETRETEHDALPMHTSAEFEDRKLRRRLERRLTHGRPTDDAT